MPKLHWGVKSSFVDYIASLRDGVIQADEGAEVSETEFTFEFDELEESDDALNIRFNGRLAMAGHGGFLWVMFAYPRVQILAAGAILTVRDTRHDQQHLPFATLSAPRVADETIFVEASLHPDATWVFENRYATGSLLDPIEMNLPLVARHLVLDRLIRTQ